MGTQRGYEVLCQTAVAQAGVYSHNCDCSVYLPSLHSRIVLMGIPTIVNLGPIEQQSICSGQIEAHSEINCFISYSTRRAHARDYTCATHKRESW